MRHERAIDRHNDVREGAAGINADFWISVMFFHFLFLIFIFVTDSRINLQRSVARLPKKR